MLAATDDHTLGASYDLEMRASQISRRHTSNQLSYRSASSITKTKKPIQGVTPRQALRDIKKKFTKLEKKKKLAIWSKKLVDMKAKKAVGFSTARNLEVEAENKIIAQKIH